jgi:hypothetical protein
VTHHKLDAAKRSGVTTPLCLLNERLVMPAVWDEQLQSLLACDSNQFSSVRRTRAHRLFDQHVQTRVERRSRMLKMQRMR